MKVSSLSATARSIIRDIADGGDGYGYSGKSYGMLVRKGYITKESGAPKLTAKGRREHSLIMESGDGPEDLKEMFRW